MTQPIRAYEIARFRSELKSLLTDLCDVLTQVVTQSTGGDTLINWIVLPGAYNVPMSFQHMTLRPTNLESVAERVVVPEVIKCYFAYDAPVAPGNRIRTHDGMETWNVRGILDELAPHKHNLPEPDMQNIATDTSNSAKVLGGIYKVFVLTKI